MTDLLNMDHINSLPQPDPQTARLSMTMEEIRKHIEAAIEAINTAGHYNPSSHHQTARLELWAALEKLKAIDQPF